MTTQVKVERTIELDDEFMDCLTEMAGYGINYWCNKAIVDPDEKTYTIFLAEPIDDNVPTEFKLTYKQLAQALVEVATGLAKVNDSIQNDAADALWQNDAGYIDSLVADCVVQIAAFDELVFG